MWTEARHIQVPSEEQAVELLKQWQEGADFAKLARSHSTCPTAAQDGNLGLFDEGHMPAELSDVFREGDFGCLYGPIRTEHGYHLVEVISRRPA